MTSPPIEELPEEVLERIEAIAAPFFTEAIAQGLNSPFALDVHYWGREYADKLSQALAQVEADAGERS